MTAAGSAHSAWFVLRSRHRYEQRVVKEPTARGLEAFLPGLPGIHQWKDRKKTLEVPAFIGYLFARFEQALQNRVRVLITNCVLEIPGGHGISEPIDPDQINRGPLKGLRGTVARLGATLRVPANITSVRQVPAVEVALDGIAAVQANSRLQMREYLPSASAIGSCPPQISTVLNAFGG